MIVLCGKHSELMKRKAEGQRAEQARRSSAIQDSSSLIRAFSSLEEAAASSSGDSAAAASLPRNQQRWKQCITESKLFSDNAAVVEDGGVGVTFDADLFKPNKYLTLAEHTARSRKKRKLRKRVNTETKKRAKEKQARIANARANHVPYYVWNGDRVPVMKSKEELVEELRYPQMALARKTGQNTAPGSFTNEANSGAERVGFKMWTDHSLERLNTSFGLDKVK